MIDHGALTRLLLDHLGGIVQHVGDGVAPYEGGWMEGQPNSGVFVPYVVLVSQGAMPKVVTMCNSYDWDVSWSLRSFGGSRRQCDWIATQVREAMEGIAKEVFGADPYEVRNLMWGSLGAVQRIDTVDPPFWQVFDSFSLYCSRAVGKG